VKKGVKNYTINKEEKVKEQTCSLIAMALLSGIGESAPQGPLSCETKLVIRNRKQETNMIAIKCLAINMKRHMINHTIAKFRKGTN